MYLLSSEVEKLHKLSGFRTFPKVFVGTSCIGGCDDLTAKTKNGEFLRILDKVGITYSKL